jgi:methyltransferase (TIGR00027 family)
MQLGYGIPEWLHLVPIDFESGESWLEKLAKAGFDVKKPAVISSTGVSMYLTKEATDKTFREVTALAPGTTLAMTFLLPLDMADPEVRPGLEMAEKGARASGTPFISFYTPAEIIERARAAGFTTVQHVSADELTNRYFANRTDGLRPPRNAEELLVARTSPA